MNHLQVALIQADLSWENPTKNIGFFSDQIQQLAASVDVIVLPEMFTTGFSMHAKALAEPENDKTLFWMKDMAYKKDCCITGSIICEENNNFYNRLYWVFPDGTYKVYNKKHLFTLAKEHLTYTAGTEKLIVSYKGWKICPLICYDLRFPVWARNSEAYDILIYVANWPKVRVSAWDALLKARAIENMCYCIGVNRVGEDGNGYPYSGHSAVYDALGELLTKSNNHNQVFSEVHQLEYNQLQTTRSKLGFLKDKDDFQITS